MEAQEQIKNNSSYLSKRSFANAATANPMRDAYNTAWNYLNDPENPLTNLDVAQNDLMTPELTEKNISTGPAQNSVTIYLQLFIVHKKRPSVSGKDPLAAEAFA